MEARKHGKYIILWNVIDDSSDDERVVVRFKDPNRAADYALRYGCYGVQMTLCKPEWNLETMD